MTTTLAVGKPYMPGHRTFPEGSDYNYRSGAHELRLFLAHPTPKGVAAVESGPVEFGLMVESEGLFLVVRFGRALSFDCSYQWHRVDPAERVPPPSHEETSPELRVLLTIILVDAQSGLVRALRAVTFAPEFTRAIHCAIADQITRPFDDAAHSRWADSMLRYSTDQLWARTTIRCRGGE
jgi:hypothetical protein